MGLADRDYMRERRSSAEKPFVPPPDPSPSLALWVILISAAFTFVAYHGFTWISAKRAAPTAAVRPAPAQAAPVPPAQRSPSGLTGNWDPNRSVKPEQPRPAATNTTVVVTKCVVNGVTMYSDSECNAAIRRSQITIDPQQNSADGLRTAPPAPQVVQVQSPPAPTADSHAERKQLCELYEEEIRQIDARARQPISAGEQDFLAAERKKARDAQFRRRC